MKRQKPHKDDQFAHLSKTRNLVPKALFVCEIRIERRHQSSSNKAYAKKMKEVSKMVDKKW